MHIDEMYIYKMNDTQEGRVYRHWNVRSNKFDVSICLKQGSHHDCPRFFLKKANNNNIGVDYTYNQFRL